MSFGEIAKLLEEKKLIKDKNVFRIQYLLSEYKGEIEPGSYVLNTSQTAEEMLRVLSRADEKRLRRSNDMIVDERMTAFINSLDTEIPPPDGA